MVDSIEIRLDQLTQAIKGLYAKSSMSQGEIYNALTSLSQRYENLTNVSTEKIAVTQYTTETLDAFSPTDEHDDKQNSKKPSKGTVSKLFFIKSPHDIDILHFFLHFSQYNKKYYTYYLYDFGCNYGYRLIDYHRDK